MAVRPGFFLMIFSTSSGSIGGAISLITQPIEAGVVRTPLNTRVARSSLSFGPLQVGLYLNSPGHQFAARCLQARCNLTSQLRHLCAAEAFLRFAHQTLGINAAKRPLNFYFQRDLAQQSGAERHRQIAQPLILLLQFPYRGFVYARRYSMPGRLFMRQMGNKSIFVQYTKAASSIFVRYGCGNERPASCGRCGIVRLLG